MDPTADHPAGAPGQADGAQVAAPPAPGQVPATDSTAGATVPQEPSGIPTGDQGQVTKLSDNDDLTQFSDEDLAQLLQDPENLAVVRRRGLREADYTKSKQQLAEERRVLELLRGETLDLGRAPEASGEPPELPTQPPAPAGTGVAGAQAANLLEEFQQQYPTGSEEQFWGWVSNRVDTRAADVAREALKPFEAEQQQREIARIEAQLDTDYAALSSQVPHALEPGVREAVDAVLRTWKPDRYTPELVRQAYCALHPDKYAEAQGKPAAQQPGQPAAQPQAAPAMPSAQALPPSARTGEPQKPVFLKPEDRVAAMLKDPRSAKLDNE